MKLILKNSAIKRCHIFKITPLKEMVMIVEREEENEFDPYAMVVKIPEIDYIPLEDRNKITREKEPQQRVKDIILLGKLLEEFLPSWQTIFLNGAVYSNHFLVGIFNAFNDLVSLQNVKVPLEECYF